MNRLALFLLLSMLCGNALSAQPPNIVLIVSDDQGYRDLGCFGSAEALTPCLDRLANDGARLTNFYVTWPACTPSRGSLLTGRFPQRNGVYDMIRNEAPDYGHRYSAAEYAVTFERIGGMDTREILLPQHLKAAGYSSAIFGKWDLGSLARYLPTTRGFDAFYGFVNTGIDYFTHERYGVPSMYRNDEPTTEDKGHYCTTLFCREALKFLESQQGHQPFFLYVPFNAPHSASNLDPKIRSGAQATDEFRALYPALSARAGYSRRDYRYAKDAEVHNAASKRLEYLAAISCMDAAIGDILAKLEERNLTESTIVIFFSDNGGGGGSDNSPLRGGKAQLFEGGIRVPCIVRFPGRIPAGVVVDEFLTTLEIFPTLLALGKFEPPAEVILDGFDMLPVLSGARKSPRESMFWQRRGDRAARVGDWKWVDSKRGGGLYNLSHDLGERNDLSDRHPEKLAELQRKFSQWRSEMDATEPRGPFRDY